MSTSETEPVTGGGNQPQVSVYGQCASGKPWLLTDQPSKWQHRMDKGLRGLIAVPADDTEGGYEERRIDSPALTVIYPLLYGNEMIPKEALDYPYFYQPLNRTLPMEFEADENLGADEYAFMHVIAMRFQNLVRERDGDLYTRAGTNGWEASDTVWHDARLMMDVHMHDVEDINLARFAAYASVDESEQPVWQAMRERWGIEESDDELFDLGYAAVANLTPDWEFLTGEKFDPFTL